MDKLPVIYVEQLKQCFLPYGSLPVPNGIWDCLQANKAYDETAHEDVPHQVQIPHIDRKA
jgi:hypothetical protein